MKLIYLGAELDSTKEYELFNISKEGFKVSVTFVEGHHYVDEVLNNITEVHNLYDSFEYNTHRIAFESDIHRTGCNRTIDDIDTVVIELSDKLEDSCFS